MIDLMKLSTLVLVIAMTCTNAAPVGQPKPKPNSRYRKAVINKKTQTLTNSAKKALVDDCGKVTLLYRTHVSNLARIQLKDENLMSNISKVGSLFSLWWKLRNKALIIIGSVIHIDLRQIVTRFRQFM